MADTTAMDAPDVCFAKSGEISIAYATVGDGPFDLVFVNGWVLSALEHAWEGPAADFFRDGAATLADIAQAAGVAEPTVCATFKKKPNLVEHLLPLSAATTPKPNSRTAKPSERCSPPPTQTHSWTASRTSPRRFTAAHGTSWRSPAAPRQATR